MHQLIEDNRSAIEILCREFSVARLEVFGSIMTGEFSPLISDIDFLVTYPDDYNFGPWGGRLFELEKRLETLLGHKVDLVTISALNNKWFRREANKTQTEFYEEDIDDSIICEAITHSIPQLHAEVSALSHEFQV